MCGNSCKLANTSEGGDLKADHSANLRSGAVSQSRCGHPMLNVSTRSATASLGGHVASAAMASSVLYDPSVARSFDLLERRKTDCRACAVRSPTLLGSVNERTLIAELDASILDF